MRTPRTVHLHVGSHKAGSTAIQEAFYGYEDSRLRYSKIGVPNHSVAIYTIFSGKRYDFTPYRKRGVLPSDVDRIAQEYRQRYEEDFLRDSKDLILSAETISILDQDEVRDLRDFLRRYFDDIHIVGYVRSPWDFVTSSFQQHLKGGQKGFHLPNPNYRFRFKKIYDLFDRGIEIAKYDTQQFEGQSVIFDFCQRLGADPSRIKDRTLNVGMSAKAAKFLLHFALYGPKADGSPQHNKALERFVELLVEGLPGPKFQLPKGLVKRNVQSEDLEWLFEATGIDFRQLHDQSVSPEITQERYLEEMASFSPEELDELRSLLRRERVAIDVSGDVSQTLALLFDHFRIEESAD